MNVEIVDRLWAWKDNLPPALQVQLDNMEIPYLPHVLLLQYVRISFVSQSTNTSKHAISSEHSPRPPPLHVTNIRPTHSPARPRLRPRTHDVPRLRILNRQAPTAIRTPLRLPPHGRPCSRHRLFGSIAPHLPERHALPMRR